MITTCTECQARYQLDAEKIPPRMIKVRCPSCGGVFSLDGSQAKNEAAPPPPEPQVVQGGYGDFSGPKAEEKPVAEEKPAAEIQSEPTPAPQPAATVIPEPAAAEPVSEPAAETTTAQPAAGVAVMDRPAPSTSSQTNPPISACGGSEKAPTRSPSASARTRT